jgi:lipopolysaccharide export LptBFGC system permease protein LptF
MLSAGSHRFIVAAMFFLLFCVSVLSLAATSTLMPWSGQNIPELRAEILSSFLR